LRAALASSSLAHAAIGAAAADSAAVGA
jgi:hypothetical protein